MLVLNPVNRLRIVLVADLINRLLLAFTHIKPVGTVDYDSGDVTHVLIRVNDPGGHEYGFWVVFANDYGHNMLESFGILAIVPQAQLEI